jgi:hypothetical protein
MIARIRHSRTFAGSGAVLIGLHCLQVLGLCRDHLGAGAARRVPA